MEKKLNRNIRLTFAGLLTSRLGTYIYDFAISLFVLKFTESSFLFSLSLVVSMLPQVLLSPVAGIFADKRDKKKIIVATDALSGLVMLLLYAYSSWRPLGLGAIYTASFFLACFSAVFSTAFAAAIPELVDSGHLVSVNALRSIAESGARIAGPILGGMIYALIDIRLFILFNGISFLLSALSEVFIDFKFNPRGLKKSEETAFNFVADFREGLAYAKSDRLIYNLIINIMFINFFAAVFSVAFPYGLVNVIKLPDELVGIANGSVAVGMLVMSILLTRKQNFAAPLTTAAIGIAVVGISFAGMGFVNLFGEWSGYGIVAAVIGFGAILGLGQIVTNIPLEYLFQTRIPQEYLGRLSGILGAISIAIYPIGTMITGVILEFTGTASLLILSGFMLLVMALKLHLDKSLKPVEVKL